MGRRYHSSRRSGYRRPSYDSDSTGLERALQHIEDAKRLSAELGGTDADVKKYFFDLEPAQMSPILDSYEHAYGNTARQYAEATLPSWRVGRVKMSGTVAERLFNLLPPRMALADKYKLTESLWQHFGPASKKRLRIGLNAVTDDVVHMVGVHLDSVVVDYKIPDQIERRFNWLSAGDVGVKQQLLNHLKTAERRVIAESVHLQLPVMISHLKEDTGGHTKRLAQVLKIGKHELELLLDEHSDGATLEEWRPPTYKPQLYSGDHNWLFWVIFTVVAFYLLK